MLNFLRLNQRGLVHLIPLLIILIGIIGGVYLVKNPTIFKPKAASKSVEILDGDCIKSVNGEKELVCDKFQFKVTSPLEGNQ